MRICILITTYRRNPELFRLLDQCRALVLRYTGPNQYRICVTDSDPANAMSSRIQTQCDQYVLNPGSGFDDNLNPLIEIPKFGINSTQFGKEKIKKS